MKSISPLFSPIALIIISWISHKALLQMLIVLLLTVIFVVLSLSVPLSHCILSYTGQYMERCNVCNEKNYLAVCAHCDKKICEDCKAAHSDILKREIGRINNQVREDISAFPVTSHQAILCTVSPFLTMFTMLITVWLMSLIVVIFMGGFSLYTSAMNFLFSTPHLMVLPPCHLWSS